VEPRHQSVLPAECLRLLDPQPGETWVDATCGGGGHSRLIADAIGPTGRLIALDQDETMLALAAPKLAGLPVTMRTANFDQLPAVLEELGIARVNGVIADLGFSSDQLDDPTRGLSFRTDGPLDMRLDKTAGETAADLVNRLDETSLANVIYEYGEERLSRRIAKRMVERRAKKRFETTAELADAVRSCVPRTGGIDPATRTFQALRIAVNDELGSLDRLLAALPAMVAPGGRAGIISFHSLEDRRVKTAFRNKDVWVPLTKKPVEAGDAEVAANPRARSAKLRVAKRT
jgi:16S rRNA (cytosine1402-N4)-methyltransferase